MRPLKKSITVLAASAAAIGSCIAAAPASAQSINSWIGPLSAGGINYLHYSTIADTPALAASSRIYTVDGNPVPPGQIGARARLFKSGSLCKATNYVFNSAPTPQVIAETTGDCGNGSYNSHGFVQAWNGNNYTEVFTFPTNPLNYNAPAARTAAPESGRNSSGQTFGSAAGVRNDNELPELVSAIATNGRQGYVASDSLVEEPPSSTSAAAAKRKSGPRTVPVVDKDGKTKVGDFVIQ